ncbi:hypothetical protein GCM10022261_00390 [Brevibacterium daeguense]|uniref:Uncharacterized protein n=1 Tax=Brevibacterium daeguense TaxID=909936 RepID=A0ABP8EEU4_9MICO|nr:hypothetical protein [Brevibacterium daeguense]
MLKSPSGEAAPAGSGRVARVPAGVLCCIETIVVHRQEILIGDLSTIGLAKMSEHDMRRPWPEADIIVDLTSRYEIDFLLLSSGEDLVLTKIGGAKFPNPHPDEWWKCIHERGEVAMVVASVERFLTEGNLTDDMRTGAWFGLCPVTISAFADGLGSTGSGQPDLTRH